MAAGAVATGDDPLVAHLPSRRVRELAVGQAAPVTQALDPGNWYNPRDPETMKQQYTAFDWKVADGAFRWRFATNQSWTDTHLRAPIPACDGLRLAVNGEGAAVGLTLEVVIKDADSAEFAAPRRRVLADPQTLVLPLAGFTKASWSQAAATVPRMPITGLKLVLYGTGGLNTAEGTVVVRDLAAVWGTVSEREERAYDAPGGAHPCLVVDDPGATALGRDPLTGEVVVAARRGQGSAGGGPRQVLSTVPYVPRELLAALMDEAGVHRYVTSPDVIVRAEGGLIALHTARGGEYGLVLPRPGRVRDALTGKPVGSGQRIILRLAAPSTTLLEVR
jgi:hypothetical protein